MSEDNSKKMNLGYWIATGITCLVMAGGGTADLLRVDDLKQVMETLGYPLYLMTILGVAKWMAVIALLAPRFPRLKEWAYAGITFDLMGAFFSHIAVKDPIGNTIPPVIILAIALVSYATRPASRRLASPGE